MSGPGQGANFTRSNKPKRETLAATSRSPGPYGR